MRAGKKAIGGPHAPAGRTHAVQCVGGDYVRMYYVPACVSVRDGDGDDGSDGGLLLHM